MRNGTGALLRAGSRVLAVTLGVAVAASTMGAPAAAAETAIADGAFSCAGAPPADARLTGLAITPEVVSSGAGAIALVFGLDGDVAQPPVVTLATNDGATTFTQPAVADPAGWRADVTVPEDAAPAELGVTVDWVDGQATPCGLQARGLPSVVAFHPTAPAAPTSLTAIPGDGWVALSWTRGADGLAPLTGYQVVTHPGGQVHEVSTPGALLQGLTNGVTYTFDVVALNDVGSSPVATSAPVVPRRQLVLASLVPAPSYVVYGGTSTVTATVRTTSGDAAAGVPVDLYARRSGSTSWVSVAHATSSSTGAVRLSALLGGSSTLALVHNADSGVLATRAVGSVAVAARVTAAAVRSTVGAGYVQEVRGSIAPGGAVGSQVLLQRYYSGAWRGVASGALTSTSSYKVRWTPAHAGSYRLRVVRPAVGALLMGTSPAFTVTAYDTRVSVAREILADRGILLDTTHFSGVVDRADARHNITYTASGLAARRSSYGNAPGGSVMLDLRMLRLLRRIGQVADVRISELAGGEHSPASLHYQGKALDVYVVNGHPVSSGSGYWVVVRACQSAGATQVFYPAHDPFGGHQGHVHCAFS